jgi:hypothetical protein
MVSATITGFVLKSAPEKFQDYKSDLYASRIPCTLWSGVGEDWGCHYFIGFGSGKGVFGDQEGNGDGAGISYKARRGDGIGCFNE